jgi:hypothetical protein
MKLRISGKGDIARGYRVWVDDVEQERVTDVTIVMSVGRANKATITYTAVEVDLDVDDLEEPRGPQ